MSRGQEASPGDLPLPGLTPLIAGSEAKIAGGGGGGDGTFEGWVGVGQWLVIIWPGSISVF